MKQENIKIVRLSSGEELLCNYESATETIFQPVIIIPAAEGKLQFVPYMPYADVSELVIDNPAQFIMFIVDPMEEMKEKYRELVKEIEGYKEKEPTIITPDLNIVT